MKKHPIPATFLMNGYYYCILITFDGKKEKVCTYCTKKADGIKYARRWQEEEDLLAANKNNGKIIHTLTLV